MAFQPTVQTPNTLVRNFPIYASGTTFNVGDLVFYDTTNFGLDICGANPSLILGIAGCGKSDAALYANSRIPVFILTPETSVTMSWTSTNPSDTDLLLTYGITRNSGYWQADSAKSGSNQRVTVTGVSPARTATTATNVNFGQTWVHVRFLAANLQGDSIAS